MIKGALELICVVSILYVGVFFYLRNPVVFVGIDQPLEVTVQTQNLRNHVEFLTSLSPSRSASNINSLNQARDYIITEFGNNGCEVELQSYEVADQEFTNIICSFATEHEQRIVAGAHYDVHYENNPGADDNASGVAGILEIARLLGEVESDLTHRVDLVAYTLEELPHFMKETMGSAMHAKRAREQGQDIMLMMSLEMIGYFSDLKGSQKYPYNVMKLFYPNKGNYIAVIGMSRDRSVVRQVKEAMRDSSEVPVYSLNAPKDLPGVSYSDHAAYWDQGFAAVMVTDTSFMRNPNYHTSGDRIGTLDFDRMSEVVKGLYNTVIQYK